jgi:hypothetical protein
MEQIKGAMDWVQNNQNQFEQQRFGPILLRGEEEGIQSLR